MIIAIDGPAGAGKSTAAKRLARRLDAQLIDTGALYRAVGYMGHKRNIDLDDPTALADLIETLEFSFQFDDGQNRLFCNGESIDEQIRNEEVGELASRVSAYPEVRDALLDVQRDLGEERTSVLEGRDIGTVVFPDAEAKYFVTASLQERARRRLQELRDQGQEPDLESIRDAIRKRDRRDRQREVAPLKKADDAVEIDTTDMSINEVVDAIFESLPEE